jgi:hypothetical protein
MFQSKTAARQQQDSNLRETLGAPSGREWWLRCSRRVAELKLEENQKEV